MYPISRLMIFFVAFMLMSCTFTGDSALYPINFMRGDNGTIIQISTVILEKSPTLSDKGFGWIVNKRGLVLTNFETGEIIAQFDPKSGGPLYGTYALDNNRLVINYGHDIGIWNFKTNNFTYYKGKGSGEGGRGFSITGVSPNEDIILSCQRSIEQYDLDRNGLIYNDMKKRTVTKLFNDYNISSPLFSPDGTRYAFYGRLKHKADMFYMIIHTLSSDTYSYETRDRYYTGFTDLMWSPTGKYLAGVGATDFARYSLHIWDNSAKLLARIPFKFFPHSGWLPVWSLDEKSVVLFYMDDFTKKDYKILNQEFILSSYGL